MKKYGKEILFGIVIVIMVVSLIQNIYQSKVIKQLEIDKSAWKHNYYEVNDEYREYRENHNLEKYVEFLESFEN